MIDAEPFSVTAKEVEQALEFLADSKRKAQTSRFFKTQQGQYGEGDIFIGVSVPDQRKIAQALYQRLPLKQLSVLLSSPIHEMRSCALFILVRKYEKAKGPDERKELATFYQDHFKFVNNWDLVDSSCYKILGRYCYETKSNELLVDLAKSDKLWLNRIAIVATMYHLKKDEFELTEQITLMNLHHSHDLIQKANGWLLRELGKRDENRLLAYLTKHARTMPRTSLRYAIERLDPELRSTFLKLN